MPTPPAAIEPVTLNLATRATSAAVELTLNVRAILLEARAEDRMVDPAEVDIVAADADDAIQRAHGLLVSAGGRDPEVPAPEPIPLHLLDTPHSRNLLSILEEAQAAAERVDASRGRALPPDTPLQPGESRGTDLAEAISVLVLRLRNEVYGASGGGRE